DIDRDCAVHRVVQLSRTLRLAMRGAVGEPARLTMQARPSAAWMPLGGVIHEQMRREVLSKPVGKPATIRPSHSPRT
ncbi:MAG: hypothetical protein M3069_00870, partial [Chloroflexota bacterium]|nr:hypothetical protein [Chloroflexota bacterium]